MRYEIKITWSNGDITTNSIVAQDVALAVALAMAQQCDMVVIGSTQPIAIEWQLKS